MLALDLAHDRADNAGTDFRILRQLGDDVAQEGVALARMDRRGGGHHGGQLGIRERHHAMLLPASAASAIACNGFGC